MAPVHRLEIVVHTVHTVRTVTYRMHRSVHNAHGLKSRAPTALSLCVGEVGVVASRKRVKELQDN
jgi:hypothetical protein